MNNNSTSDNFSCGVEKLTSTGAGGCSNYSEIDVENKLGSRLKSLRDDCRLMDSGGGGLTKGCNKCLRTWREIAKNDTTELEDDICRFSMLILLTSQRVSDESWVDKIFHCLGDNSLPLASADECGNETRRRTKFKTDLWILIGGVVGMVLVIIVALWILSKRKVEVKPSNGRYISDEFYSEESTYRTLSLKEIYSATDNLSMSNFIGQGLAGKVYKGILADRKHVAVKHIIKDEQMETFVREVTSLWHIKHPNLVSLLGHYDGPNECFLVYELRHNGNISEWLFANILLSASFEAKLSDFGLSKIISIGHSYASSEVRGTFGYVDPEYHKNRHVNTYGDVYSFGIVLLQLLSGQRVINVDLKKSMPLNKMVNILTPPHLLLHLLSSSFFSESFCIIGEKLDQRWDIKKFADPKLEGKFSMVAFELVFKLALSSIGLKKQTPSMEQVVIKLEGALDLSTRIESVHP
ncbi:hypothetical protein BC332_27332 [Capsicum chinense]|nr:hypothetical protein BC332_27332 [Capsicum chinense]